MTPAELLTDAFERVRDGVRELLDGLDPDDLAHRPTPNANPIGWLVWHLVRVQDDHVADVAGTDQAYGAFVDRFDLPYDPGAIGTATPARTSPRSARRSSCCASTPTPSTSAAPPTSRGSPRPTSTGSSTTRGTRR